MSCPYVTLIARRKNNTCTTTMSDEYTSTSKGTSLEGSLIDCTESQSTSSSQYKYPPPDDSTSLGNYGPAMNAFSSGVQRGKTNPLDTTKLSETGLVEQSLGGSDLKDEVASGDAEQGNDSTRLN